MTTADVAAPRPLRRPEIRAIDHDIAVGGWPDMTEHGSATCNLVHLARILKDAGGIPAHGNQRPGWDAGCRFDVENPEYR